MTRHASRVTVIRTDTGFRYKHHAHTSHDEWPTLLDAARAAVTYAYSMDWVYVVMQQSTLDAWREMRALAEPTVRQVEL